MPLPLLAIVAAAGGAAAVALRRGAVSPASDGAGDDASGTSSSAGTSSASSSASGRYSARVEQWRADLDGARGSLDLDFLLRWIARESDGDPASVGNPQEVGIGQVFFDVVGGVKYGYVREHLHASTHDPAQLTADERWWQVDSLVQMATDYLVHHAGPSLAASGLYWEGQDIYALTKLWHALPVLVSTYLPHAAAQGPADSWDDFRAWGESLSVDDAAAIWSGIRAKDRAGNYLYYPLSRFFANAQWVGRGN